MCIKKKFRSFFFLLIDVAKMPLNCVTVVEGKGKKEEKKRNPMLSFGDSFLR